MEKISSILRGLDEAESRMKGMMTVYAQSGASPHLISIRITAENRRLQSELHVIEPKAQLTSKNFGDAAPGRDVSNSLAALRKNVNRLK
jgi:phage shock protein A